MTGLVSSRSATSEIYDCSGRGQNSSEKRADGVLPTLRLHLNSDSFIPRDGVESAPEDKRRMVDDIDAIPRISGNGCACEPDGTVEVN